MMCDNATGCNDMAKPLDEQSVHTIEDIARLANVSKSTVSRALNNSSLINRATRERIQAIAREQNFHMHAMARNLSLRQSFTIAFVAPVYYPEFLSAEDLFGLELLGSIGNGLHNLGYDLLLVHAAPEDSAWAHYYFDIGRVDGFIIMASNQRQWQIKMLVEMGAPFVAWGVPIPGFNHSSVTGDNFTGGKLATQHLIEIGRRRIAFLGGPVEEMTVQLRYQGYENALLAAEHRADPNLLAYGDYTYASGITAMQHLMEVSPDLDAVFVNSDLMAIGAIQAIQNRGKHVPEDIAVVGYDDLPIAAYNNLPLTTIRQNIPLAGQLLAQNLVQSIQTGTVTNVTVPVELVVRRSA
jgi:DNA-binding LacI/PurR family transcriptional regulator